MAIGQRSFDELGTPLHAVTFCVVDLETTGTSPADDAITEIGAVKLRGGECLGTFSTLVNPDAVIPPAITFLTGITTAMVVTAPRIDAVLASFLEFAAGTVLVGHNFRFDTAFLDAALVRHGYDRLRHPTVDTCGLARRLVRDEVRDCRLHTLSQQLRLPHRPCHRALADALATGDLLHALLERAGRLGVLGLDDLLELPTLRGHPQAAKLRLTERLPRTPGVYLFRDRAGRVLYVGKATNLRSRVRSYFAGDDRRKVGSLLRETAGIDHVATPGSLEAAVLEVRLIHHHLPRFNRVATSWRRYRYVQLTMDERFPRLTVVRSPRPERGPWLGPLPSARAAKRVVEAIEAAVPLRRCTARPPATPRAGACAPAQLGVATCPCAGTVTEAEYAAIVAQVQRGMTDDPELLLGPLERRMHALAAAQRYEEAADVRDRGEALASAVHRGRRLDGLRRAGRLVVELPGEGGAEVADGRLVRSWPAGPGPGGPPAAGALSLPGLDGPPPGEEAGGALLPAEAVDEASCVAAWLDQESARLRVVWCEGELASPARRLPRFRPLATGGVAARRGREAPVA